MAKRCQLTGRGPTVGHKYTIRGIAKKKKGIGLKVTGKTRRRFLPNLLEKRIWLEDQKRFVKIKLSAAALRTLDKIGLNKAARRLATRGSI
ncbi:MAG: 50S ribosomal protein L28 [Chlamydiia bacterium]|nr:50S ribosomal protein L28 [Chlamydiia bacterium]